MLERLLPRQDAKSQQGGQVVREEQGGRKMGEEALENTRPQLATFKMFVAVHHFQLPQALPT